MGLILAAAAILLFSRLGDRILWQDEAMTACLGQTVLKFGVPKAYDGLNYFSQFAGKDYNPGYLWSWHGWLTFYMEALSLKIFGNTSFAGRLPFAIIGFLNIPLLYLLALRLFGSRRLALISAGMLAVCVPFLLLARQARYFSLVMFLATSVIYFYMGMNEKKKWQAGLYTLSLLALFHTLYVQYAILAAVICLHSFIFYKNNFPRVLFITALTVLAGLPFLLTIYRLDYARILPEFTDISFFFTTLAGYLNVMAADFMPVYLLPLGALAYFYCSRVKRPLPDYFSRQYAAPACLIVLYAAVMLLFFSAAGYLAIFRNMAPLFPALIIAAAACVDLCMKAWMPAGIITAAAVLMSWMMPAYLYEITHDFNSGNRAICRYLKENAGKNDIVATPYNDLQIKFYTGLRVVGGLTGEDLSDIKKARWVIFRPYTMGSTDEVVKKYMTDNLNPRDFTPVFFNAPDLMYDNKENISEHVFYPDRTWGKALLLARIKR